MSERADDHVLFVIQHVALDDTQIRVLDLQPGGRAHERCDLMAELQCLSHQLPASSAGRTDNQDVEPVSPSARNRFNGRPTFWSLARESDREREPYTIKKIMIFTLLIAAVAGLGLQTHL